MQTGCSLSDVCKPPSASRSSLALCPFRSFHDPLKVRNGADVGQSASEVCRLISAGPGGAGDAGKQGGAGITESQEEPEILNINVSYCGAR